MIRYFLIFLLLSSFNLYAQRVCHTMEQDAANRLKYPTIGSLSQFEELLQNKIEERRLRAESGRIEADLLTIPIIVHVIHSGADMIHMIRIFRVTNITASMDTPPSGRIPPAPDPAKKPPPPPPPPTPPPPPPPPPRRGGGGGGGPPPPPPPPQGKKIVPRRGKFRHFVSGCQRKIVAFLDKWRFKWQKISPAGLYVS